MISNKERREVAAKLRETEPFEYGGEKWYDEGKILDALDLSFDNVPSIYDPEKVKHLADLIDRPTTKREGGCGAYWRCTRCGAFNRKDAVTDCCGVIPSRYCAYCSAEVIE